ncbi:SAM-dependent methyltransferase [Hyphomicrobium sp.]|uniref:class I SAM-dependent methyltransferase n=1 Tax=Hyphomicrobium sp. TaxID=82 RepID=UPI000F9D9D0F|nr:SAM-dependent methyltransferase [Hyphomicrobium sp.]RUO97618.1 MAG: SAM-dependent methyltransferase [Hyphomicrobium sp.]
MNVAEHPKAEFVAGLRAAINDGTFVKLSLGKFRGEGEPRKAVATLVMIKDKPQLKLVTSFPRKDDTKTFPIERGVESIARSIGAEFMSATLFTSARDLRLDYSRKGIPHLASGKPTMAASAPKSHDRQKSYLVAPDRPYLKALDVTDRDGRIKPTMQGKYKQICRFIEIAADLIPEGDFEKDRPLTVVDIGSGKGYLTFAFYDYVTTVLNRSCQITGIEVRGELVKLCNDLARDLNFKGLTFVADEAARASSEAMDIVIALHACDTATDDAMAFGIQAGARLILSAPCCQHELAPQIHDTQNGLRGLIKYPLLKQRQADLVTDAARALLLEVSGYKVRLIEFVSTEHTSKNILIAATKSATVDRSAARQQFQELQETIGFSKQHLASQLKAAE